MILAVMPKESEHWKHLQGRVEMFAGPMFSGKSSAIINLAEIWQRRGASYLIFKHPFDTRYEGVGKISSHDGRSVGCEALADPMAIYQRVMEIDPLVVIIDEVQFYIDTGEIFVEVVRQFAREGRIVVLAGLNLDFRGEPFGPMPVLLAVADQVNNLRGVCAVCGDEATFAQRLIHGQPAPVDSELVIVGAEEAYQSRCRRHHEVPGKRTLSDMMSGMV